MQKDLYFIVKKAGAAIVGAINALFSVKTALKLKTFFFGILGTGVAGVKMRQSNFILLLKNTPSFGVVSSVIGNLKKESQKLAFGISSVNSGAIEATQLPAFDLLRLSYNLNRLVGGNAASLTTSGNQGWTNANNSVSGPNGRSNNSVAQFLSNALASRNGTIHLAYADLLNKTELSIQSVKLRFYYQVSNTSFNNADVQLKWTKGSEDFALSTITGNKNARTTPDEFDISAFISSWEDLNNLETKIFCNSTAVENWNCSLDAIEVEILATKIDPI